MSVRTKSGRWHWCENQVGGIHVKIEWQMCIIDHHGPPPAKRDALVERANEGNQTSLLDGLELNCV